MSRSSGGVWCRGPVYCDGRATSGCLIATGTRTRSRQFAYVPSRPSTGERQCPLARITTYVVLRRCASATTAASAAFTASGLAENSLDRVLDLVKDLLGVLLHLADRLIGPTRSFQLRVAGQGPYGFLHAPFYFIRFATRHDVILHFCPVGHWSNGGRALPCASHHPPSLELGSSIPACHFASFARRAVGFPTASTGFIPTADPLR